MTHDDEYEVSEESLLQEWLQITRRTPQPPSKPRRKSADDVLVGPRGQRMRRKSADAVMELPPSKTKLPPVAEVAIPSWDADDDVPPPKTPITIIRPQSSPTKRVRGSQRRVDATLGMAALSRTMACDPVKLSPSVLTGLVGEAGAASDSDDDDDEKSRFSSHSTSSQSLAALLPSPKRRAPLTPLLNQASPPTPFSPTKRLKVPPKPPPSALQRSLPRTTMSERTARVRATQALKLHTAWRLSPLGRTFADALRHEFPSARADEVKAMLEFVASREAADVARRAKCAARWSDREKHQLLGLFHILDADASGTVSAEEFEELAAMMDLRRASLRRAYERFALEHSLNADKTELPLPTFLALVETLDASALASLREKLPGLVLPGGGGAGASAPSGMLVFDDGKSEIWRLVPGGRSLVKKTKRGADGTWGSAFSAMIDGMATGKGAALV